jgi:hypothetical protein
MNEWYSRDISKKRRLTNTVKGNAGEPLSMPPYGYMKDPDNAKRWLIDEETAPIVRRIYEETLSGRGTEQIAAALERDKILTPMNYWFSKGLKRGGLKNAENPYNWNSSTIIKILTVQEYCGDVINFKTYSKSFKLKKRLKNDEENMAIFRDVNEAIIDRDTWDKVQEKRAVRKRKKKALKSICSPGCSSAPIAGVRCGTTSTAKIPILSFSVAPAITPETRPARQGITYELTFWKKRYYRK